MPTRVAYNSLTGTGKPITVVNATPVIAESTHDWQTLKFISKAKQLELSSS